MSKGQDGTSVGLVRPEALLVMMPSPVGDLGVEIVEDAVAGIEIAPGAETRGKYTPFDEVDGSDLLDEIFGQLSEYFAGVRRCPEIKTDIRGSELSSLSRRVLKEAAKIPYGRTRTYGYIAEKIGRPEAYRQVLAALVTNPLPILIPCHRVVTHKSGIGSYVGGPVVKRQLLTLEKESLHRGEE